MIVQMQNQITIVNEVIGDPGLSPQFRVLSNAGGYVDGIPIWHSLDIESDEELFVERHGNMVRVLVVRK